MRPTEFSNEDIVKAGSELQATGRNVTGFALRQKVGGGSAGRLRQVWDEYLSTQSVVAAEPVAELPVEVAEQLAAVTVALVERLKNLATELNDKAVKASERRVSEVVRSAGDQRAAAERELADASLTVDDLESKLDAAEDDKELLRTKLDAANDLTQRQAVEIAQLQERLKAAEQSAQVAHEKHATDLAIWRKAEQAYQEELTTAKTSAQKVTKQHADEVRGLTDRHTAALSQATATQQSQAVELAQLRERLATTEAATRAATEHMTAATAQASQAREDAARMGGKVDSLEKQVADLLGKLSQK